MAKNDHKNNNNALSEDIKNQSKQDKPSEADILLSDDDEVLAEIETAFKEASYSSKSSTATINKEDEGLDVNAFSSEDNLKAIEPKTKGKLKKNKKEKKNYEKKTFMQKMKVLGTLLVLGVFTGSGLGVWYFNVNIKSHTDYSANPKDYLGNVDEVLAQKFDATTKTERENWKNYAGPLTPADLTPVENFLLAEYKATLADSFLFVSNGKSVANILGGITQTVFSKRRFNGTTYSFESISKGTLSIANLDIYKKGANTVDVYKGTNISQRDAKWNFSKTMTTDAYIDMTGSLPSGITPYIISEKTVKAVKSEYNAELGQHSFTFTLDPVYSALIYYKEMRRTGDLEGDPEFSSIEVKYTIDNNWNLISSDVVEFYKAIKLGMATKLTGTLHIDYNFNCEVEMPNV